MYKKFGKTVLYIPMEGLQCSPAEAKNDKKLVQRMESKSEELSLSVCVYLNRINPSIHTYISPSLHSLVLPISAVIINWTDQIKEQMRGQDTMKNWDNCGLLQEIACWKSHSVKLLDLMQQLQKPGVRHIEDILRLSKSLYVERFLKLAIEIQVQGVCEHQV